MFPRQVDAGREIEGRLKILSLPHVGGPGRLLPRCLLIHEMIILRLDVFAINNSIF